MLYTSEEEEDLFRLESTRAGAKDKTGEREKGKHMYMFWPS